MKQGLVVIIVGVTYRTGSDVRGESADRWRNFERSSVNYHSLCLITTKTFKLNRCAARYQPRSVSQSFHAYQLHTIYCLILKCFKHRCLKEIFFSVLRVYRSEYARFFLGFFFFIIDFVPGTGEHV